MRRGRRIRCGPVDAWLVESPARRPRIGVVVPRHGGTIVARNRVQRRLREILRRDWLPAALRCGDRSDLVVRARRAAREASYAELREALLEGLGSPCSEG